MRRVICICMAVMLCLSMAGCGVKKEEHPLAVFEGEKIAAELGMTKEEIIKKLGKGEEDGITIKYDGMEVAYWHDTEKVCQISFTDKRYTGHLGLGPEKEIMDDFEQYGIVKFGDTYHMWLDENMQAMEIPEEGRLGENKPAYMLFYEDRDNNNVIERIVITEREAIYGRDKKN